MNKTPIFLIILIILSISVIAAPPFSETQVFTGADGLEIKYPIIEVGKINTAYYPHFHVFNLSNGYAYTSGINCTLHLYNFYGEHIYQNWSTTFSSVYDIVFNLPSTLFNEEGVYSYIIQCHTTDKKLGGFVSDSLVMTDTGSTEQDYNIIAILVVYVLSIMIYLIFSVINYNLSKFKLSNMSFWLMLTSAAFAIVNFVSLLFVVLFYHNNWSLTTILNINAYMTALTLFGIGVASLYVIILRLFDFTGESDNMGKWGNEKEGKTW